MISDDIGGQITNAMKAGDKTRVATLKLLSNALHNIEIEKKREKLTSEEEIEAVRYEAKKRKDAIEAYEKAGNKERADTERAELEILNEYLPKDMDESEVEEIVKKVIGKLGASSPSDFGKVMGATMAEVKGRTQGEVVAAIVTRELQK